jgi:hypothetical protein
MILHVNPCVETCHDPDGSEGKPFSSIRHVFDYVDKNKIKDYHVRYYCEGFKCWINLI